MSEAPIGLAFAVLKGAHAALNQELSIGTINGVHGARCRLHDALELFRGAHRAGEFMDRFYDGLAKDIVVESEALLVEATNELREVMRA